MSGMSANSDIGWKGIVAKPVRWRTSSVVLAAMTAGATKNCQIMTIETGDPGTAAIGCNSMTRGAFGIAVGLYIHAMKICGATNIPTFGVIGHDLRFIVGMISDGRLAPKSDQPDDQYRSDLYQLLFGVSVQEILFPQNRPVVNHEGQYSK